MTTDRELLEKAAKAAGVQGEWCEPVGCLLRTDLPRGPDGGCETWNPLTDDGDALRLAVKLEIEVCFFPGFREIRAQAASVHATGDAAELYAEDMAAATRRAIVRAAAAMAP